MTVHRLSTAAGRLQLATGLAAVLDAACDAFEEILAARLLRLRVRRS